MSTKPVKDDSKLIDFAWDEVARALFAREGISSGLWHLGVRVNFMATTVRTQSESPNDGMPTGMVGMAGLALRQVPAIGPMVFDASRLKRATRPPKAEPQIEKVAVVAAGKRRMILRKSTGTPSR